MQEIFCTKNKIALVDDEDFPWLSDYSWYAFYQCKNWYCRTNVYVDGRRTAKSMHQFLILVPKGMMADHVDGNGLNNQKSNLRAASRTQNRANQHRNSSSSGLKGVYWHSRDKVWQASIDGKHLGYFEDKMKAALAYAVAAKEMYGEFARYDIDLGEEFKR